MKLSKSSYLSYLQCPREFWLRHHKPELFAGPDSTGVKHLKEMGHRVQMLAQELFSRGGYGSCEFEKRFETGEFIAKADIYTDGAIYEVKSSGSVKDEHIYDLAFQKAVAELAGTPVEKTFLVHVDKEYVRQGGIEPEKLFQSVDVTEPVNERLAETKIQISNALLYLKTEPDKSIAGYCGDKLRCTFIQHFHQDLPEYTIFDISNLKAEKINRLLEMGALNMLDVPDDFELSPRQRRQIDIVRSAERYVSAAEISEMLSALEYPIYFLDYETVNPAIPIYEGYRPFQVTTFQYSVHVLESDGGELAHYEFLAEVGPEPTAPLLTAMRKVIEEEGGTVIVWSAYESTNNKNMSGRSPEFAGYLDSVTRRTFDLMGVFSKGLYIDPKFRGSYSIKNVLPVMLPEMTYEHLQIKEGTAAAAMWLSLHDAQMIEEERSSIRLGLLEYCAMDTLAMVEIFKTLKSEFCE
jgi:hypothetical protein